VFVRQTNFPWVRRYGALVMPNPRAEKEGVTGYELALDAPATPVETIGDAAALARALTNLVQNAIQHGPRHGTIGIRVPADRIIGDGGKIHRFCGCALHVQNTIVSNADRPALE